MISRRKHVRKDVVIAAHLLVRDEKPRIARCTVVDISEGGARIQLDTAFPLPSRVFLVKDEGEIIYECEPAWQREQMAGLMFLDLCAGLKRQEVLQDVEGAQKAASPSAKRARQPGK
jgi:hypothetical protein